LWRRRDFGKQLKRWQTVEADRAISTSRDLVARSKEVIKEAQQTIRESQRLVKRATQGRGSPMVPKRDKAEAE
jgi:hypothetical protein